MNEDKASRYQRLSRCSEIASILVNAMFLAGLVVSGGSLELRELSVRIAARLPIGAWLLPWVVVGIYVALLVGMAELIGLPLAFYRGHVLEHRYELSRRRIPEWAVDHLKGLALGLVWGLLATWVVYGAIWQWAARWWIVAAAVFGGAMILLANLAPVVLLPLFYRFKPLERASLRDRLVQLAARARTPVLGVYEWSLGEKTRKANAGLVGLGRTRRIILSDTLLDQYSDDEIEVVLAHELAHHVHRDIWQAMAYETVLIFAGFYVSARVLSWLTSNAGAAAAGDIAGLPVILLTAGGVSLIAVPLFNALSRSHERRADRYALEMTRNPAAFIAVMRRLGAQNLVEESPSRLVEILFHTHPPLWRRIEAARRWARP
ncbi:MAG: M48 family metallopeptidase [Acidobacteria bacterium]|nr:M48 family metallopeptidase [Acidobacteriota bacterium]